MIWRNLAKHCIASSSSTSAFYEFFAQLPSICSSTGMHLHDFCFLFSNHYKPPPPPPPSPPMYEFAVRTAEELIPTQSAEASDYNTTSRIVRIAPLRRNVYLLQHPAQAADLQDYEWLLRFADTGLWYEKPGRPQPAHIGRNEGTPPSANKVIPMSHPQPMSLNLPKVWASAALATSLDNTAIQHQPRSLKSTPLVYCLILSTYDTASNMLPDGKSHGRQMYKLVRCGSREAAVAEAFYAAGVHGWNVSFACVMRLDEDFVGTFGKAKKVKQLSKLGLDNYVREDVRVFY